MPQVNYHSMYLADEAQCLEDLIKLADLSPDTRSRISERAKTLVEECRAAIGHGSVFDALLQEYGLSSEEGVSLMRLVEALIRTPDAETARYLIRDKLSGRDWKSHSGDSPAFLVNRATNGLMFSQSWIKTTGGQDAQNLLAKLGDKVLHQALKTGMGIMSRHFVLGSDIDEAQSRAKSFAKNGYIFSYDMLGEAAYTWDDAKKYKQAYLTALERLKTAASPSASVHENSGLSVKLSALHPRYEFTQKEDCVPYLVKTLKEMALIAKSARFGLSIDAEEADKLELSIEIIEHLMADPDLADWPGFSVVVQAYQRRAVVNIERLLETARRHQRQFCIRLVKGAYWDSEIKRAQEMGLKSYPVFTRKENTDVSYLACARLLLAATDIVYPQFATHNAATMSAVLEMAGNNRNLEFQRLHGMGEILHDTVMKSTGLKSRIYAPVGRHKELLPYLVRRLLENGANSSFVNQFLNPEIAPALLAEDPIAISLGHQTIPHDGIPAPRDLFSGSRLSAKGFDHTQAETAARLEGLVSNFKAIKAHPIVNGKSIRGTKYNVLSPANPNEVVGTIIHAKGKTVDQATKAAKSSEWISNTSPARRATCLRNAAQAFESNADYFLTLCVKEAGKTWLDAIAEIREAIDFLEYYAAQAELSSMQNRNPLGVVACISPWNFPFAIFLGQVSASLAAGNAVICKPAEQTPLIAFEAVKILHAAGVPTDALHFMPGPGSVIGAALTASPDISGVCFTGSTATAKRIARSLADTDRAMVPLIAETGGLNAMIIDSTALLEQAVSDVIASGFQSAGQRCSACRLVCVQDDIFDAFATMLSGAMQTLDVGNPALIKTDLGPVIDAAAMKDLKSYIEMRRNRGHKIFQTSTISNDTGFIVPPTAIHIASIDELEDEQFGPIVHIYKFNAEGFDKLIFDINALGYGLTMGIHTRIDERARVLSETARVGNIYVNRNQIGAVVGTQPFGGEGLSGTGPKAGGPNYMKRLSKSASIAAIPQSSEQKHLSSSENSTGSTPRHLDILANAKADASKLEEAFRANTIGDMFQRNPKFKDIACAFGKPINLPGPTGETNQLRHFPRGVVLCEANDQAGILLRQIMTCLATGNFPIVAASDATAAVLKSEMASFNLPALLKSAFHQIQPHQLKQMLALDIDGLMSDSEDRYRLAKILITQDGPIRPVLSIYDDIYRFGVERTLTIDVSAAGGNATLLAL